MHVKYPFYEDLKSLEISGNLSMFVGLFFVGFFDGTLLMISGTSQVSNIYSRSLG